MLPVIVMAFGVAAAAAQAATFETQKRFFTGVFEHTPELALLARTDMPQPRVVCGMLLLPADPSIDPRIRVQPPTDADYKIKVVRPPVCVE